MKAKILLFSIGLILLGTQCKGQFYIEPNIGIQFNHLDGIEPSVFSFRNTDSKDVRYGINFGRSLNSKFDISVKIAFFKIRRNIKFSGITFLLPESISYSNYIIGVSGDYYLWKKFGLSLGVDMAIHSNYKVYNRDEGTLGRFNSFRSKFLHIGVVYRPAYAFRLRLSLGKNFDVNENQYFELIGTDYISFKFGYAFNL